jgi:hypothetical protein
MDLSRFGRATNERPAAHVAADQAFGFEFRVRIGDRGAVHAELHRKLAARRDAVSRTQIACVHQRAKLVPQLDVKRNMAFRL